MRQPRAMDHAAFLASLPPATRAALTARSDRAGLLHLAGHGGAILVTGALIAARVPLWPLLLPVEGVLLVFLFTLAHEATHRTPFASDRLSDGAGRVAGFFLLMPFGWFRAFHLAHHRFTNDVARDPELEGGGRPRTRAAFWWHVSGLPFWRAQAAVLWHLARGTFAAPYASPKALPRMEREARVLLGLYALAALSLLWSPLVLWLWVVPVLLGQPALRLYLLAEHGDCPHVADMFLNTRTTFTTGIVRFLAWNMPYHAEHHVYPMVPFHRLPDLHDLMAERLGVTAEGYAAFTAGYLARR